ncbi:nucleoside kinase [Dysgonomonas macrotermitis]|uniref:Uridine kinase n=1 Tax=Dysgonomonas macrotermitis TaxID=1346286 RepID=A0A1M5D630_9BACT|nr:nucleoside kinase [Dysgonomonas macrotermitis]SHF62325.1 uridine kinase [Dysgonomonas macrotermitis]
MEQTVKVFCKNNGQYFDLPMGTSLLEAQTIVGIQKPFLIVNCKVNNKTESLNYRVYQPKDIEYVDISESSGMRTYVRSLCFILAKAVSNVFPRAQMSIEHPIAKGYYGVIQGKESLTDDEIWKIKSEMERLVKEDLPFEALEAEAKEVVELFRQHHFEDKALLLETSDMLYAKYYRLGHYVDYFYGCLVPSTSYISLFELEPYMSGFMLRVPNRDNPDELESPIRQPKMQEVFNEHLSFLNIIGLDNVGDLNKANRTGNMSNVVKVSEALQEKSIADIATQIAKRFDDGVRIVLISGPSSSGKTTFRKRLEVQLMVNRIRPVGISLDDYFVNRVQTPRDEFGEYDYESLYALDLKQFNEDMARLLKGDKVSMPSYNFTTGQREYKGHDLQINKHTVLVIEGIHGLNPELTSSIPDKSKFLIYVSALTAISLDNHNWIPTTDNRLIRRLIRDYKYRNYSAIDTISRWNSVRRGEDKWIFPFQENADVMFNSAIIYELAALRKYAEPILMQVPKSAPEYAEANRLMKFLSYFNYINDKEMPPTSLLREFLGGSSFKY